MRYLALLFVLFGLPARAAYYAELDKQNVVVRVVVVDDAVDGSDKGAPDEARGIAWCEQFFGGGIWVRTSQDGYRHRYAGKGMTYYPNVEAFVPMQPFASWTLNTDDFMWVAPVPEPSDGKVHGWDEASKSWVQIAVPK